MRAPRRRYLAVSLFVGAAAPLGSAHAQPAPGADADALLERAQLALETNDTAEQVASLRGLSLVAPEPKVTCALGMVERRLGQFPEAAEHLTACVEDPPPGKSEAWLSNMRAEKAMARAEVGVLTISAPVGAEVTIDNEQRGAVGGREIFLEPKREHRVDVRRNAVTRSFTLSLGRGASRHLVALFPAPKPTLREWLVFGGAGAGGALAVGAGILYGASAALYAESARHLEDVGDTPGKCYVVVASEACASYKAAFNNAGLLRDAALAGWIAAGGIGAVTAIAYATKPGASARPVTVGLSLSAVRVEVRW